MVKPMAKEKPCDYGECPYNAMRWSDCEYHCKLGVPDEDPDIWNDYDIIPVELLEIDDFQSM